MANNTIIDLDSLSIFDSFAETLDLIFGEDFEKSIDFEKEEKKGIISDFKKEIDRKHLTFSNEEEEDLLEYYTTYQKYGIYNSNITEDMYNKAYRTLCNSGLSLWDKRIFNKRAQ
jgi:hypothetical protein